MSEEQSPVAIQVVRYGVPLIIVIFYLTASLTFAYTPESTFLFLQAVGGFPSPYHGGTSPSPLWHLLVTTGGWLHLDAVLTVKVFSMLFCSFAVLIAYLFAVEAVADRVAGLFVGLCVAVEPWLVQLGPSGSGMSLGLALSLAALFFMKRGDYPLAALAAGLCSVVLWQGIGLVFAVVADMAANRTVMRDGRKSAATGAFFFIGVVAIWLLYAIVYRVPVVPALVPFGDFPRASAPEIVVFVILGGTVVAAPVVWAKLVGHTEYLLRIGIGGCVWCVWLILTAVLSDVELARLAIPVLITYAFLGLEVLLVAVRRKHLLYTAALVLSVPLLLAYQMQFYSVVRPSMRTSIQEFMVLEAAASWLRVAADNEATVAAEKPGIIGYYSAKKIRPFEPYTADKTDFIVTSAHEVEGYDRVFMPGREYSPSDEGAFSPVAVWKRK